MPSHSDEQIRRAILSQDQLERKFRELTRTLEKGLNQAYLQAIGMPIPSADHAKLLHRETAVKDQDAVNRSEFVIGLRDLANKIFQGDDAMIARKAIEAGNRALDGIFEDGRMVKLGARGYSARFENGPKSFVASAYASTSLCPKEEWLPDRAFYVCQFVFAVIEVPSHRVQALMQDPRSGFRSLDRI